MAGYIFSLDSLHSLDIYTRNGVYATKLSVPTGSWMAHHEGTFADYATMREGDNVYFFINRRIYGIGKLTKIRGHCKFFNYPEASKPRLLPYQVVKPQLLWDENEISVNQRCICTFVPDPYFFRSGIDMDDVLSSNPTAFKMLRAFWKLSFIKFTDEENQAFRDIILKRNQSILENTRGNNGIFPFEPIHRQIEIRLMQGGYELDVGISHVLQSCAEGNSLKHEMALEAGILNQLAMKDIQICSIFGKWDYLSHQVIASPFKPIDYMDKMDLFGYSYIPGYVPTISRFLVGEVKKDPASLEDVDQLLKYVDWVKDEYCFGDYSMIHAFLVASDIDPNIIQHRDNVGIRKYTIGVRPARSLEWTNLKLVVYSYNPTTAKIDFNLGER